MVLKLPLDLVLKVSGIYWFRPVSRTAAASIRNNLMQEDADAQLSQ